MELNLIAGRNSLVSRQGEEGGSEATTQAVRGVHFRHLKSYPLYLLLHILQGF